MRNKLRNRFYDKLWKLLKAALFKVDAEFAHHLILLFIRIGIWFKGGPLRVVSGTDANSKIEPQVIVFGMPFLSRVGLAAGFDKNSEILRGLPDLGFGFAEIGTVTPLPQPGNPRPRLFRLPQQEGIFNCMGFNGLGATLVAQKLRAVREHLPENFRVGVNLGKNKNTSLEDAHLDYARVAKAFEGLADYLVVNVSSPNTPGLRLLQTAESLKPILDGVNEVIGQWRSRPPLLLKLAPEVSGQELVSLIRAVESMGVDGWVFTNTLASKHRGLVGGLSGKPLTKISREKLIEARTVSQKPIISVGGICTTEEGKIRIQEGADLIQIYSGWIYRGPSFPNQLRKELEGLKNKSPGISSQGF